MSDRDLDLYNQVLEGDKRALEELYDKYEKLLYSFAYKSCGQKEMAEEVMQEVFIKVWTQKATYDSSKGKFSSWILSVTRFTSIDIVRKKENQNYSLEEERDTLHQEEPSAEDLAEWKEQGEIVREAVKQLSEEQNKIIQLFYFKGLTQREIASSCNLSLGTVKGRIRLALKHLRKELSNIKEKGGVGDA
ncbi:sigma-70 family RNA polymerase sigma factor [Pontibacillus yanchengensis]|uniref:Sigma-70 family RNA polymerase sigma factor n=1 Tax=Pontibacillus yanchengensis TaxID=462910 RepID=A0A6I5A247_9BACI|nr:sigma-70 family RNA polymerase sigma factor [Pontibacillus yanchengensis]MYL34632.1 sigma-70 family RNA polymerase sigma factor [Pontibacillus yanchengensis]